ncbi:alpha/beta hydrolase [Pseudoalteromonas byunsanensis]|uniref:alpha/beta hydrolase n=1 Tax=Pseudoalteromonas byunsanensis TaxID=327939 RepID=UPI001FE17774|nr:alpha/beta hydrolase-fold protein [Pseudoalteromonas byunsanensis]
MNKLLFAVLVLLSANVSATNFANLEVPQSRFMTEMPKITIALPASYNSNKSKRYPVLYLLDGDLNGELVYGALDRLHASKGAHEHIIVGVSSTDRLRDFAPTINQDPRGPVGAGGGADKLLDFMQKELMTTVNKQYRTNHHNVIAGHSIAGLFVIHTFHTRPNLFQAHMAFSPAVWWAARETAKATKQYVLSDDDVGTFLYMNIGSEGGEMRQVYDDLSQTILRNRSTDLALQLDTFDSEDHDFTMVAGLYRALKALHGYQSTLKL